MATTATSAVSDRIGELLVREGLISNEQLAAALQDARSSNARIGYSLVKLGYMQEADLTRTLAKQYRVPAVDLDRVTVDPKIIKLVPAEQAWKHLVLPLRRVGRMLTVAMANPTDAGAIDTLKFITRHDIEPVIVGEYTLRKHLEEYYAAQAVADDGSSLNTIMEQMEGAEDVELIEEREEEINVSAMQAQIEDAPVVKLINALLTDAVTRGVSDIHIEPFEKEIRIRYRIDGALMEVMKPPMKMKNKVVDFRVSTLPVIFGEKIVMRILDKGNLTLDLEKFGFEPKAEKDFMASIMNPYGMVLVTGPTGSGKTTTLYSALSKINTEDVNIMTAEDPVEYNIYGINQVLVRNEIGMTFAAALKAFLRQDPNIIMVGEIRDLETGGIAIKAALTGHLVLSTLHTNSTAETVTRLLDMGLEPFNVSSALNLVLAQRLLRRVCSNCKERHQLTPDEIAGAKWTETTTLRELRFKQDAIDGLKARAPDDVKPLLANVTLDTRAIDMPFFRGKGCDQCKGSGSRGRQGAYEVMNMSPGLRRLILSNVGAAEIKDFAIEEGMLTLRMDGLVKVWKGITSLEQVITETSA